VTENITILHSRVDNVQNNKQGLMMTVQSVLSAAILFALGSFRAMSQ